MQSEAAEQNRPTLTNRRDLFVTKACASGNDFIILDNRNGELDTRDLNYGELAKDLCRRKFSIGADGLLVLESSDDHDFRMRIINPDGSEVDMCGNGARASAMYAYRSGWGNDLSMETRAGKIKALVSNCKVKLKMSDPRDIRMDISLGVGKNIMNVYFINTGVPHVVHIVDPVEEYDVKAMGRAIREHSMFAPEGTNVNFVGNITPAGAVIRTYERGVEDETLACGTGTVASALILGLLGRVEQPVSMRTGGGEVLTVYYKLAGNKVTDVFLEGSANIIFEAKV